MHHSRHAVYVIMSACYTPHQNACMAGFWVLLQSDIESEY